MYPAYSNVNPYLRVQLLIAKNNQDFIKPNLITYFYMRYCRCIFREVRILYELLFIIFNLNSMKNYHNPNSSFFFKF